MVLIGKGRLGSYMGPETPYQAESTESIIRTTWNTEAMWQQKSTRKPDCSLTPTGKEVRHIRVLLFYD